MDTLHQKHISRTLELAEIARQKGNHPFGAMLVKNDSIIAEAYDKCVEELDPTSHAEIAVIRQYCSESRSFDLRGLTLYTNVAPCMMCAAAAHYAGISRVYFCLSRATLRALRDPHRSPKLNPEATTSQMFALLGSSIELIGPIEESRGLRVFDGYNFPNKNKLLQNKRANP